MTRKELIEQAALKYRKNMLVCVANDLDVFTAGAEWADANPDKFKIAVEKAQATFDMNFEILKLQKSIEKLEQALAVAREALSHYKESLEQNLIFDPVFAKEALEQIERILK